MTALGDDERRLELLERMIRIREFEEGVRFLFLEGSMPGTIHQCQGQEATAVGVCAALAAGRFHHLDLPRPRPRHRQGALRAGAAGRTVRRLDRLLQGQGRIDACGQHEQGHGPRHRHRRRRHPAGGRHGAGVQDAEDRSGRRLLLRRRRGGRGRVPRGRQHGGDLAPAGDLRLREQSLRRLDPHRPRDEEPARRRSRRLLRHSRARPSTATTSWRSTRRPERAAARCRAGDGPVLLELLTYRQTGHSRRDPRALPAGGGAEGMGGARSDRELRRRACRRRAWRTRPASSACGRERRSVSPRRSKGARRAAAVASTTSKPTSSPTEAAP